MIRVLFIVANSIAGAFMAFVFFASASDYRFRGCLETGAWQCSNARWTMWIAGSVTTVLWANALFFWLRGRGNA